MTDSHVFFLRPEEVLRVAYEVLEALEFMNKLGMVHRALSAHNVLMDCKVKHWVVHECLYFTD